MTTTKEFWERKKNARTMQEECKTWCRAFFLRCLAYVLYSTLTFVGVLRMSCVRHRKFDDVLPMSRRSCDFLALDIGLVH
ncbi:MAG: hypothetical protein MJA29_10725, partial [Candidatus Omnitrophica bacterium]|nr:hypothetical protein [Candidatus Omnitrophota bacterium]